MSEYEVIEFSGFNSCYEDVLKDYRNSFPEDFQAIKQTIKGQLEEYNIEPKQVTGDTYRIPMGERFRFKALKTYMMIKEAQSDIGRLVWIFDEELKNILLVEVYHKNDRTNHNEERIARAHNEYYEEYYEGDGNE
ncbi:MAG: hypothetical protein ABEJ99_05295 [Candidatus Nanohaloarchaea archaeon]